MTGADGMTPWYTNVVAHGVATSKGTMDGGYPYRDRMGCVLYGMHACIMGVGRTGTFLRNRHTGEDGTGHWLGLLHPGTVGDLDL